MNQPEWITFCTDFAARFPSDFEWLDAKPKTVELWFTDVFSGLGLAYCLDVSQRLFKGTIEPWKAYERDRIPSVYQYHVGLMRKALRTQAEVSGYTAYDRKVRGGGMVEILTAGDSYFNDGKSMLSCFRHCEKLKTEGVPLSERNEYVEEYFGSE